MSLKTPPALAAGEVQRRAASGAVWSSISIVVSIPVAVVTSVVAARTLGPTQYGRFAFLTFVTALIASTSDIGWSSSVVRRVSQTWTSGDVAATQQLLRKTTGWNWLRAPILGAAILLVVQPSFIVGLAFSVALCAEIAFGTLIISLSAENRGATMAKLALVQGWIGSVATVIACLLGGNGTSVWVVTACAYALPLPIIITAVNPTLRSASLVPALPRELPPGFVRYALIAMGLSLGATLVWSRSEIILLQLLHKPHALAVFALAFGLAQRLTTPVDSLLGPLIPALAAIADSHSAQLASGLARAIRLCLVGTSAIAATLLAATTFLAPILYGAAYRGVAVAFLALGLISLVQSAAQPYIAIAYAVDRLSTLLKAHVLALATDVLLALLLIPPIGLWGAVLANIGAGALAIGLVVYTTRPLAARLSRSTTRNVAVSLCVSCGISLGCGFLASRVDPLLGVFVALIAGGGVFLVVGKRLGGLLPSSDIEVFTAALPQPARKVSYPIVGLIATPAIGEAGGSAA